MTVVNAERGISPPSWYEAVGDIIGQCGGVEHIDPRRVGYPHVWFVGDNKVSLSPSFGMLFIRVDAPKRPGLRHLEPVFVQPTNCDISTIHGRLALNSLREVLTGKEFTPYRR